MPTARDVRLGQLVEVKATGQILELVTGPGHTRPGTQLIHTGDSDNEPVAHGLDRQTRQISLYLLKDLRPLA